MRLVPGSGRNFYRLNPTVQVPEDDEDTPDYMKVCALIVHTP